MQAPNQKLPNWEQHAPNKQGGGEFGQTIEHMRINNAYDMVTATECRQDAQGGVITCSFKVQVTVKWPTL